MTQVLAQENGRLQAIRRKRGFSAAELAGHAGISRQTVYAIEDGSFVPNTVIALKLARALQVTVEDLFSLSDEAQAPESVRAELLSLTPRQTGEGQFVRLSQVGKRWIAAPVSSASAYLPPADGVVENRSGNVVSVKLAGDADETGRRILVAGCDPALSLLAESMQSAGTSLAAVSCSSRQALEWLKQGRVHAAGSHLLDSATGQYNVPIVNRLFPNRGIRVITFAEWEQGLIVRRGNPKRIRSIADFGRKDVAIVNREKGSGSRLLLDKGLLQAGIPRKAVTGYGRIASGHLAAASEVAGGAADCCIATCAAARCFGLDFIPLAVERFDLAIPKAFLDLPAMKALVDQLTRSAFRRKLASIAGYDTAHSGQVLV